MVALKQVLGTFSKILPAVLLFYPGVCSGFSNYQSNNFSLNLTGYYKNLFFTSKRQATDTWYLADVNRIRTEWDATFFKILSAKVAWDNELTAGDFVNTEEFDLRQTVRNRPYLDLDYDLVRIEDFFYGQRFYRAYAKIDPGPFILTVGRQRVAWGVVPNLLSPADLFTELPIFAIEKEEIVGVTAANLEVPVGSSLRINPVYAFNPDFDRSRIGARVTKTVGRFDLSALGGRFLKDAIFGFDFAGDIKKAGVKGEFIYDIADGTKNFIQAAAAVDYGFENTLSFSLEYFFEGSELGGIAGTSPFVESGAQIQMIHEHFLSLILDYDLTPLWTVRMLTIADLTGGSFFLNPESQYSIFHWLEVTLGGQFPVGKEGGEFTRIPNLYYVQTQFFF